MDTSRFTQGIPVSLSLPPNTSNPSTRISSLSPTAEHKKYLERQDKEIDCGIFLQTCEQVLWYQKTKKYLSIKYYCVWFFIIIQHFHITPIYQYHAQEALIRGELLSRDSRIAGVYQSLCIKALETCFSLTCWFASLKAIEHHLVVQIWMNLYQSFLLFM